MTTTPPPAGFMPGPWAVSLGTPGYRRKSSVRTIEVLSACSLLPVLAWPAFDESERSYESHLANARLIAAAPDLLAVCKAWLSWYDAQQANEAPEMVAYRHLREIQFGPMAAAARLALAKAGGGT